MSTLTIVQQIEQIVASLIEGDSTIFLVDIKIKPTNNIKLYLDGDKGIAVDELIRYNRAIYKQIEEAGYFPEGDFSLEVSSPGIDEPLKLNRQYVKNINRFVEVQHIEGAITEGQLLAVSDSSITVLEEKGKGKKKESKQVEILFQDIKATKVQVRF